MSMSMYIDLSLYPSIPLVTLVLCLYVSASVSLYLSISLILYLSNSVSVYLCLSLSISVYLCLSLSISVYLSIYLSIHPSIHPCIPPFVRPSVCLSNSHVWLPEGVYTYIYIYIYIYMYVCMYVCITFKILIHSRWLGIRQSFVLPSLAEKLQAGNERFIRGRPMAASMNHQEGP